MHRPARLGSAARDAPGPLSPLARTTTLQLQKALE